MAKRLRKAARPVRLEDIVSMAFVEDDASLLNPTLRGHLALEALLVELLALRMPEADAWRMNFPQKADAAAGFGFIRPGIGGALKRFNDFRNDFAHIFGHATDFTTVHRLAHELEMLGVDFSDSVGRQPAEDAATSYGGDRGVMAEILWCLLYEVAFALLEAGGRDVFAG